MFDDMWRTGAMCMGPVTQQQSGWNSSLQPSPLESSPFWMPVNLERDQRTEVSTVTLGVETVMRNPW